MSARTPRDEAFELGLELDQAIYDDFIDRLGYHFGGQEYELADSEVGEPFTLIRKSDGARFEVELSADVRAVTQTGARA